MPRDSLRYLRAALSVVGELGRDDWAVHLASAGDSLLALQQASAALTEEHARAALARRRFRKDRWHSFVTADIAVGGRRAFRWVRQPALQEPPALVQTPSGLQGGGGCRRGGLGRSSLARPLGACGPALCCRGQAPRLRQAVASIPGRGSA